MAKLNYLLIMPKFLENTAGETIFPLGIAYISSSMKKNGFNVFTLNLNHIESSIDDVLSENIKRHSIDVVLMGGLSFQYSILKGLVDTIKRIDSKIKIIVGGGIITGDPIVAMKAFEIVDFGIIGEGEESVCELCSHLEEDGDYSNVKGIVYKSGRNEFFLNEERCDIKNLDDLPFPDYEGFDFYKHVPEKCNDKSASNDIRQNLNSIYIIGSRSCPYNCTFCFHTSGKKYRQRSLDNIFEELDYLTENYDLDFIGIQDELFSHNRERIIEFCKRIKKYNLNWWAQFRVDAIDEEIVQLVKESGCQVIGFGLESANNSILKSMKKGTNIDNIDKALELVYKMGMPFIGTFIFGDKEETYETAMDTINWWKEHHKYRIDLRLLMVYPGSALYKYAIETKKIADPIKYLKDGCPQINISKMTDEEFAKLSNLIMTAPIQNAINFSKYRYQDKTLVADCANCGYENTYNDFVFFTGSYLTCKKCGQKHNVELFSELLDGIEESILKLISKYKKISIWGVNYYVNDLIEKLDILKNPNIYIIDISEVKQKINIGGVSIHSPQIINDEDIELVIVGVPAYKLQIEKQVYENYKSVHNVIDICDLIS